MTPLERKQIQIQATRDVLFEQSTGKKAPGDDSEDEENLEHEHFRSRDVPTKTKPKLRLKDHKRNSTAKVEEAGVRIEGLSYSVCARSLPREKFD